MPVKLRRKRRQSKPSPNTNLTKKQKQKQSDTHIDSQSEYSEYSESDYLLDDNERIPSLLEDSLLSDKQDSVSSHDSNEQTLSKTTMDHSNSNSIPISASASVPALYTCI